MDPKEVSKTLSRTYFWQLIPAAVLLVLAWSLKYLFHLTTAGNTAGLSVTIVVTTVAGVIGIALPVFYRSYFVYKVKDKKQISNDAFLTFERTLITLALLPPYFLVVAMLMNMNQTALILITLFSIYGAYYYFPGEKKILFEMKIFRIKPVKRPKQ